MEPKRVKLANVPESELSDLRYDEEFKDFEIIVKGESFRVHKAIMAAKSGYFRAMLANELKESPADEAKEGQVTIDDIDPHIMDAIIDYCYTNKIMLTSRRFPKILSAALRFRMDSLKDECTKFIEPEIDESNCLQLMELFWNHDMKRLHQVCMVFCFRNFESISQTAEFMNIDEIHLEALVKKENLAFEDEDLFETLVEWTEHDIDSRLSAFDKMVKHVKFESISGPKLDEFSQYYLSRKSKVCQILIKQAKDELEIKGRKAITNNSSAA